MHGEELTDAIIAKLKELEALRGEPIDLDALLCQLEPLSAP